MERAVLIAAPDSSLPFFLPLPTLLPYDNHHSVLLSFGSSPWRSSHLFVCLSNDRNSSAITSPEMTWKNLKKVCTCLERSYHTNTIKRTKLVGTCSFSSLNPSYLHDRENYIRIYTHTEWEVELGVLIRDKLID